MTDVSKTKVIAVIPARGRSQSIAYKNMAMLNGKPLVYYTINAALKCDMVSSVITSSDSSAILNFAQQHGSRTARRPDEISDDNASSKDVIFHVFESEGLDPRDIIVFLQPTSPFRTALHIEEALKLFFSTDANSVVSVCIASPHPDKCLKFDGNYVEAYSKKEFLSYPRQNLSTVYAQNGGMYIFRLDDFLTEKTFIISPCVPYEMSDLASLDIDTKTDFMVAEALFDAAFSE